MNPGSRWQFPTEQSAGEAARPGTDPRTKEQVRGHLAPAQLRNFRSYVRDVPRRFGTTHFPFSVTTHKVTAASSIAEVTRGRRRAPRGVVPGWQKPRRWKRASFTS